jgi:uncharacterized repeat protein (TIGR01451 family)
MTTHCTPTVLIADSTKHANPGEEVSYTLSIDNSGCGITSVTDVLPPGFHFVSASGDLGHPALGSAGGQEQLFWAPAGKAYTSTAPDGRLYLALILVGLTLCSLAGVAWFRRST